MYLLPGKFIFINRFEYLRIFDQFFFIIDKKVKVFGLYYSRCLHLLLSLLWDKEVLDKHTADVEYHIHSGPSVFPNALFAYYNVYGESLLEGFPERDSSY